MRASLVGRAGVGRLAATLDACQSALGRLRSPCMSLESSPEHPQPLRVVAHAVRGCIDRLGPVWVEAQLIEINQGSRSRLVFLTLRDTLAEVSVSVSISAHDLRRGRPADQGPDGGRPAQADVLRAVRSAHLRLRLDHPVGEGRLLARLEQTKRLLQAEGLFDPALKKRLPFLPRAVGLITGAASAAERDVVENARRRWPAVRIVTRHALVQGPQAGEQIIAALQQLDRQAEVEVIVIARGGGSLEDLLPFSDEGLVRAVFACRTPVVSAIGHESDSPILDLVADLRASTPTDAAKRVVPDVADELARVDQARQRLDRRHRRSADPASRSWLDRTAVPAGAGRPDRELRAAGYDQLGDPPASSLPSRRRPRSTASGTRSTPASGPGPSHVAEGHAGAGVRDPGRARTGDAVASVAGLDPGDDLLAHLADGQLVVEVRDIRSPRSSMTESRHPRPPISYEQAREELIRIVQRLESGGAPLDESLALWERGEQLATICQPGWTGPRPGSSAARARRAERSPTQAPDRSLERPIVRRRVRVRRGLTGRRTGGDSRPGRGRSPGGSARASPRPS